MSLSFTERPSPNFDARNRAIELVVLHYTGMQSAEIALKRLTDPAPVAGDYPGPWQDPAIDPKTPLARVSTHYVVDEEGRIHRVVAEQHRAWHAGRSRWKGEEDVNARAVGIEIVNGGHDFGLPDFPDVQIDAVIALVKDILARNNLPPAAVVGHSDIAPGRKLDPGEKFPWHRLVEANVAISAVASAHSGETLKPGDEGEAVRRLQKNLSDIGYAAVQSGLFDQPTKEIVEAFQRRFRQSRVDGIADDQTQAAINSLLAERR
ncbi:MAG: N-acetylmuramoyl-L-alanine amidase [Hyphomonadaceae bacterium]